MNVQKIILLIALLTFNALITTGGPVFSMYEQEAFNLYQKNPEATPFASNLNFYQFINQLKQSYNAYKRQPHNKQAIREHALTYLNYLIQQKAQAEEQKAQAEAKAAEEQRYITYSFGNNL